MALHRDQSMLAIALQAAKQKVKPHQSTVNLRMTLKCIAKVNNRSQATVSTLQALDYSIGTD